MFIKFILLLVLVTIAVILDFMTDKVSNKLIIVGLVSSLLFAIMFREDNNMIMFLFGVLLPIVLLMPLFFIGGMGAGDIKLFAVIGGFIGYQGVFRCIIVAILVGAVICVIKIFIQKNLFYLYSNFIQYISRVYQTRQVSLYQRDKNNTIHFTLPILISVLCYLGGII